VGLGNGMAASMSGSSSECMLILQADQILNEIHKFYRGHGKITKYLQIFEIQIFNFFNAFRSSIGIFAHLCESMQDSTLDNVEFSFTL
jgi:hypothetical protein